MPRITIYNLGAILAMLATACSNDDFRVAGSDYGSLTEEELVETRLALNVGDFTVKTPGSRHESTTEAATDDEKRINDIWVFQFGTDGNALINPRYYTLSSGANISSLPVLLKKGVSSTIYVIANTADPTWANASKRDNFATVNKLKKQSVPSYEAIIPSSAGNISLPMCGITSDVFVGESPVSVPMTRMMAKLRIKVNIAEEKKHWEYYNINVLNIAPVCPVGSCADMEADEVVSYYATVPETDWYTRSHAKNDGATGDYDFVIYVPENIRGSVDNLTEESTPNEKTEYAPNHALNIYVEIKYNDETITHQNQFTVYPGNRYDNYDIERNHIYDVTLQINNPEIGAVKTPSANCIVVIPDETVRFEPYNRTEKGGGYEIEDYIDENSEDPKKVIDYVKIIWQSEGVFGDNSDGSKVRLVREEYGPGENYYEEYTQYSETASSKVVTTSGTKAASGAKAITKIEVKPTAEGNALIGAYNSSGEVIWSWHIWCTRLDPGNIGNAKTYTTYPWSSSGIDNTRRIPGYAIMPCNLGALSSSPTANNVNGVIRTYGMNYQWGRKDPFPYFQNTPDTKFYAYKNYVMPLYDNKGQRITTSTLGTSLFRVISGRTIASNLSADGASVKYTIANPTDFLCGTYDTPINSDGIADSYFSNRGDWNATPDDKLWGGLAPNKSTMKWLKMTNTNTLYDNYGTEKSIFDPCPKGWRVSPPDLWLEFTKDGKNAQDYTDINYQSVGYGGMNMYLNIWRGDVTDSNRDQAIVSWFPTPGPIRPDGLTYRFTFCGNYHNATAQDNNKVNCVHVHCMYNFPTTGQASAGLFRTFEESYIYQVKSLAGPIRCVRDRK